MSDKDYKICVSWDSSKTLLQVSNTTNTVGGKHSVQILSDLADVDFFLFSFYEEGSREKRNINKGDNLV